MITRFELVSELRKRVHRKDITRTEAVELLRADWPGITLLGAEDLIENGVRTDTTQIRWSR